MGVSGVRSEPRRQAVALGSKQSQIILELHVGSGPYMLPPAVLVPLIATSSTTRTFFDNGLHSRSFCIYHRCIWSLVHLQSLLPQTYIRYFFHPLF